MFRFVFILFSLLFTMSFATVPAKAQLSSDLLSEILPAPGQCPSDADRDSNKDWKIHMNTDIPLDPLNLLIEASHLRAPTAFPLILTIPVQDGTGVEDFFLRGVFRTNQSEENFSKNGNCYLSGVFMYYVELDEINMSVEEMIRNGNEVKLLNEGKIGAIEIRWYDKRDKKRHRWINSLLAQRLQWVSPIVPEISETPINSLY